MRDRLDQDLVAPLDAWLEATNGGIDLHDIPASRLQADALAAAQMVNAPAIEGVTTKDQHVPGPDGSPDVFVRLYWPTDRPAILPALLWIHGGGYIRGSVERDDLFAKRLSKNASCVVASVEYRLAPEHPFPAPVEDCYAALAWLQRHNRDFGIDAARIGIGGASAGGGLAAALALLARDRGDLEVMFQLLIYPMLDDRNIEPASPTVADTFVWSRENNLLGWRAYLGREPGTSDISHYAAPARAPELAGLPPTYIAIGDLDLFLDENVAYAQRLIAAKVSTELHVYPGAFHGFNGYAPGAGISKRFNDDRDAAVRRFLHR